MSDFICKRCCFTNQYYKEWVVYNMYITQCYCVPYNHSRQSTLAIWWLISVIYALAIWVQFVWYPWYQSSSVALERLSSQVVEYSILLEQFVSRVPPSLAPVCIHKYEIIFFHNTLMTNHSITYIFFAMFMFNMIVYFWFVQIMFIYFPYLFLIWSSN
jgi:hypothetical protein